MKKLLTIAIMSVAAGFVTDAGAWGNKEARAERKAAKQAAKAEKKAAKAEKSKHAIKQWQATRFRNADVTAAITKNGKLSAEDVAVQCNLEEAQPMVDALLSGYVTIVNILDGYAEVEEGNAIVGVVASKMTAGKSLADAEAELSADERTAYDKYLSWLKGGENAGKVAIADEDLAKIMEVSTSFKEQWGELKEKIKGKKESKTALAKDFVTVAKIAGSSAKGGMMLKDVLLREKQAKKILAEK